MLKKALWGAVLVALCWPAASAAARLSRADRAQINRTLNAVVRDGVKRENPLAARPFLTGNLAGGTRAQWKRGNISLYPYRAGGNFHGWTLAYRSGKKVGVNLLLHPEKRLRRKVGAIMFQVDLVRRGHRWLVWNFTPSAIYTPEGKRPNIFAGNDLLPGQGGAGANNGRPKLGAIWMLVPAGILGGGLLLGLGIFVFKWYDGRRYAQI
jgi:hypothetical protein